MRLFLSLLSPIQFSLWLIVALGVPTDARAQWLARALIERTFNTAFDDWRSQLKDAHEMGAGKVAISGSYEWTLLTLTSDGIMEITPHYGHGQLDRPQKLQIKIEQNNAETEKTRSLPRATLLSKISEMHGQLRDRYSVLTEIELGDGAASLYFTIYPRGRFPHLDKLGDENKGCLRDCVHEVISKRRQHP